MRVFTFIFILASVGPALACACPGASSPPRSDLSRNGPPPEVVAAVIAVESGGQAAAVSARGCVGLMQINPRTGRELGYSRTELFEPTKNVAAGTAYLARMLADSEGDLETALRKYNCGPGGWRKPVCLVYARKVMALL